MSVELFFSAIGLLMIFEGLPYFINPDGMKKMAELLTTAESSTLRVVGFVLMSSGLALLYVFNGS